MKREPATVVSIVFDAGQAARDDLPHRVRNYGEDLYRALRDEKRVTLSLADVDSAIDRFCFTSTSFIVAKRAAKVAEDLLPKHMLLAVITIE